MFKLFEVKNGKLETIGTKKIKNFLLGSLTVLIIVFISGWLKLNQKDLWKFYNLIFQQFGINGELFRPKNEKEIESRIEIEVDKAIRDALPEYDRIISDYDKKYQPRYVDEKNDESVCYTDECRALAPPMRICASWIPDCPPGVAKD